MKKGLALFLTFLMVATIISNGFAASNANRIYSDAIIVEAGESVTVPVKIENNNGFMGFSIIVKYDSAVFTPVSVSKNSALKGLFNDSIETSTDNSFKVVYTGTENITSDGELFDVTFDVADNVSGKHEIQLSYSQADTFNENWDSVILKCEEIKTVVTVNGTTAAETTTIPDETTTMPDEATTEPATEPSTEPDDEGKPLSVRMREWVNGFPFPFNIILGIFVIPLAFVISIFE